MADQEFSFHVLKNPGTVTATVSGLGSAPTLDGTGLTSIDDQFGTFLEHSTATGEDSSAGLISTFNVIAAGWRPAVEFEVQLPGMSVLNTSRIWVGMFSERPDLLTPTGLGSTELAAFYLEVVGGSPNWRFVTKKLGVGVEDQDSFIAAVAGDRFRLRIEVDPASPPTAVNYFINNDTPTQNHSSSVVPTLPTLLGLGIRTTNLSTTGTPATIRWNRVSWRYEVRL